MTAVGIDAPEEVTFTTVTAVVSSNASTPANSPGFSDGAVFGFFGDLPGVLGELGVDADLSLKGICRGFLEV